MQAYVGELRRLDDADWARPTDCTLWDVRQMAAHVAGALDEGAHLTVLLRHMWAARTVVPPATQVDVINAAQIADRAGTPPSGIVDALERLAPVAARRRSRMPGVIRGRRVPGDDLPAGSTLGYLFDVIYPRDVWMHRVDTARATGRAMTVADGDAEVVAQVVRDLARAWTGPAFILDLTGDAGGTWTVGTQQPIGTVRADTVAFLRLLSGRVGDPELSVDGDSGLGALVGAARVTF